MLTFSYYKNQQERQIVKYPDGDGMVIYITKYDNKIVRNEFTKQNSWIDSEQWVVATEEEFNQAEIDYKNSINKAF